MRPLLSPQEMSAADSRTIESGTPGFVLMDRAGRAVARAAIRLLGGRYGKRVTVVCGKGNNGGDGFVAARALASEGVAVRCIYLGDKGSLRGDAGRHHDLFVSAGGRVEGADGTLGDPDVVVDAIFGTGFHGTAEGDAARAIEAINGTDAQCVSVDIPSGVDGANGSIEGPAVRADVTVTFAAEKIGTAIGTGAELAGDVEVIDIGIDVDQDSARVRVAGDGDVARVLPARAPSAHKRSSGSVAILGGSEGMSGAAILAARGAVRMGAGYATIGLPRSIEPIVSAVLPEVLTKILSDEPRLGSDALLAFKSVLERADAIAVGPGLGDGDDQAELVKEVLRTAPQPVVVDADGLNVLAADPSVLTERERATVLTPHPAELARLMQTDTAAVQSDRLSAAREAASRFGCVVVLKGFRSLIAYDEDVVVNTTGSSHLATAGTGDVLTGTIAALLAAGVDAFPATWAAVHIHGNAGQVAASKRGGNGVVAWDVAETLPEAIAISKELAWV